MESYWAANMDDSFLSVELFHIADLGCCCRVNFRLMSQALDPTGDILVKMDRSTDAPCSTEE